MLTPEAVTGASGLSLRAYARHRGVSVEAVRRAIKSGRLSASIGADSKGKPVVLDPAVADQEWSNNTDLGKAPGYVKERESARVTEGVTPTRDARDTRDSDVLEGEAPELSPEMTMADAARAEKYWTAMRKRLEYQARAQELVPAKEISDRLTGIFTRCRTKLLGIPSKAKTAFPQLTHQDIAALDRLIREALEDLADPNTDESRSEGVM